MNNWVLTIPVLNTLHVPGPEAMDLMLATHASASDDCGYLYFVNLDELDHECKDWLKPIADWAYRQYKTEWVRFDLDGTTILDLPLYGDKWE